MTWHRAAENQDGERTTELDRRTIDGPEAVALPFPIAVEPTRVSPPAPEDGALPFRSSSSRPLPPPRVGARPSPPPAVPVQDTAAPRTELGDLFRRAFGLAQGSGAKPDSPGVSASGASHPLASVASVGVVTTSQALAVAPPADAPIPAGSRPAPLPESRGRRALVDILDFDAKVPSRLRRSSVHAPLLAAPAAARARQGLDGTAESSAEERSRADVLRVLSSGTPIGLDAISRCLDDLLDDPDDCELPLFLVEGEVTPSMDEVAALRAGVEHAKSVAGQNKRLLALLATAGEALARSAPPPVEAAVGLLQQIDSATSELGLPPRHLAKLVERTLREARSYKRRVLLGRARIRADITLGSTSLPLYLPDSVADVLPLLPTFRLGALVESRPREDASEACPTALLAYAVGRVLRTRQGS